VEKAKLESHSLMHPPLSIRTIYWSVNHVATIWTCCLQTCTNVNNQP